MLLIYHNSHSCLHVYQMPRLRASLMAQQVKKKNLPAMQETKKMRVRVRMIQTLGWKDPLEKKVATCSASWITALSWWQGLHNSMRLWAMPCRANQDRWVIVKSSNKTRSTGGGNGNPLQYSCLKNPRTWVRVWRAKRCDWKMSPSGWQVPYMLLGKSRGQLPTAPERIKHLGQSKNNAQLWMCPVVKVKFDVVKNNIA